jgi:hypothetical protein
VHVSDEAVRVLLDGRDPYQASYAAVLAPWRIDVRGRPATNPLVGHYPYWPGSLVPLGAVEAPLRAFGGEPDPRVGYLLVYCLLGGWVGWWSLRERGDLGLAMAVGLSPLLLPYLWQGVNDVLLIAGLAVMAAALARRRVVLAGAWLVWSRPSPRALLAVSGVVVLGVLCFHRSFMSYYVDVPAAALLLAALLPRAAQADRALSSG